MRQLWLNLADIKEKLKNILLNEAVSPSELFGSSVETVVIKFREARVRSAAFRKYIPTNLNLHLRPLGVLVHQSLRNGGRARGKA